MNAAPDRVVPVRSSRPSISLERPRDGCPLPVWISVSFEPIGSQPAAITFDNNGLDGGEGSTSGPSPPPSGRRHAKRAACMRGAPAVTASRQAQATPMSLRSPLFDPAIRGFQQPDGKAVPGLVARFSAPCRDVRPRQRHVGDGQIQKPAQFRPAISTLPA